jgi:hypothetical protein
VGHIEIVLAVDGDENLVTGFGLVVPDKADMTVAVFARVGELTGKRHQRRNIRCAQSFIAQL